MEAGRGGGGGGGGEKGKKEVKSLSNLHQALNMGNNGETSETDSGLSFNIFYDIILYIYIILIKNKTFCIYHLQITLSSYVLFIMSSSVRPSKAALEQNPSSPRALATALGSPHSDKNAPKSNRLAMLAISLALRRVPDSLPACPFTRSLHLLT